VGADFWKVISNSEERRAKSEERRAKSRRDGEIFLAIVKGLRYPGY